MRCNLKPPTWRCKPSKPAATLRQLVRDYVNYRRPGRRADMRRFRQMPSLAEAIRIAALARRADGKCETHQCRVGLVKLRPLERALQRNRTAIRRCRSFYELYEVVASVQRHCHYAVLTG